MIPHFIDRFFYLHPWASDIAGSLLGVMITALVFVAGIVYERRRQRAQEARAYDETLYYLEQLLGKVVDWAGQLSRAYRSLSEGLRRAPLLTPEFGQYSDYAAHRLREIDRQLLFRAFLLRYGRATSTIDLYVGFYDALDYVMQQSKAAEEARAALVSQRPILEAQFRKAFDGLLTQATTTGRALNGTHTSSADAGLKQLLDEVLPTLHRLALPGTELEEAWSVAGQPLLRTLHERFVNHPPAADLLRRAEKLASIRATLLQQSAEAATRFALLGTSLQLGMDTLRSAQNRIMAPAPGQPRSRRLRFLLQNRGQ